ncbi:hypothetical protein SRIMM317S_05571 [Streptomyces rimosus subsp. rimosus]
MRCAIRAAAQALPLQARVQQALFTLGQFAGRPDLLDGDLAGQQLVPGPPHHAHPAPAQLGAQPVAPRQQPSAVSALRAVRQTAGSVAARIPLMDEPSSQ